MLRTDWQDSEGSTNNVSSKKIGIMLLFEAPNSSYLNHSRFYRRKLHELTCRLYNLMTLLKRLKVPFQELNPLLVFVVSKLTKIPFHG